MSEFYLAFPDLYLVQDVISAYNNPRKLSAFRFNMAANICAQKQERVA